MANLFTTISETAIDVIAAAIGETVTLQAPGGDVTLTAVYRREPVDYPGGDGMGGGWQLVAKTSVLDSLSCETLRGLSVAVGSRRHTITGTRDEDGGVTIIELGYG